LLQDCQPFDPKLFMLVHSLKCQSLPMPLIMEPVLLELPGCGRQTRITDYPPAINRSKRGLPRSGAKVGSTLSQPGER